MTIVQRDIESLKLVDFVEEVPTGYEDSSVPGSFNDLTTETVTLSANYNAYRIGVRSAIGGETVTNNSQSILDTTEWPFVDRVSSGLGSVTVSKGGVKQIISLDVRDISGGGIAYRVTGFEAGTVGAHSWGIIEPLLQAGGDDLILNGGIASGEKWDFGNATYNAACWASDFDFSGVSHKNSWWSISSPCATAITERHVVLACHYTPPVGTDLTFIAPNGTKVTRTILGYNTGVIPGNSGRVNENPIPNDLAVATLSGPNLSSDGIAIYPLVGNWIIMSLDSGYVAAWTGVKLTQERRAALCGRTDTAVLASSIVSGNYAGEDFTNTRNWTVTDWGSSNVSFLPFFLQDYSERCADNVIGESGHPRFFPLTSSTLALVGCVSSSTGAGPYPNADIYNACIASADSAAGISTGLTVTVAPDPTL